MPRSTNADDIKALIPTEAALCALFIEQMNQEPGWVCYPETGGFDILAAHESGRQIGVQAKLQLNAKVADQILPHQHHYNYEAPAPDHRLVIVRNLTDASIGIARLLAELGIQVWCPQLEKRFTGAAGGYTTTTVGDFHIGYKLRDDERCGKPSRQIPHWSYALPDWNPPQRIELPPMVPQVKAGVPSPTMLTPWKLAALRVLARLRLQGYITAKQITAEGCSPSMWTQRWLQRSEIQGQWLETERIPALDKQHPDFYAPALQAMTEKLAAST